MSLPDSHSEPNIPCYHKLRAQTQKTSKNFQYVSTERQHVNSHFSKFCCVHVLFVSDNSPTNMQHFIEVFFLNQIRGGLLSSVSIQSQNHCVLLHLSNIPDFFFFLKNQSDTKTSRITNVKF